MSDTELKPCPFCGNMPQPCGNRVECIAEICPIQYEVMTVEEWNTRTAEGVVVPVEQLERLKTLALEGQDPKWSQRDCKLILDIVCHMLKANNAMLSACTPIDLQPGAECTQQENDDIESPKMRSIGKVEIKIKKVSRLSAPTFEDDEPQPTHSEDTPETHAIHCESTIKTKLLAASKYLRAGGNRESAADELHHICELLAAQPNKVLVSLSKLKAWARYLRKGKYEEQIIVVESIEALLQEQESGVQEFADEDDHDELPSILQDDDPSIYSGYEGDGH